ncbi:hypothetical protein [Paeniglutamicibacter sp.]|uniref:hypothetical protein n=1 Tax=Paeniglutamicibacter sp. TaxID=1934391 RepID=UPI003989582A
MRDRLIWVVVAVVLAGMGISLWSDAPVAALGAGAAAAYSVVASIRGRCLGGACMLPAAAGEADDRKK